VQFASDVDEATKQRINKGRIITEVLKQSDLAPIPFEKQVLVLYAALNGYFNKFEPSQMQEIEKKFIEYVDDLHGELVEKIKKERAISEDIETEIKQVIEKFIEAHK
jgi:F-type H+-transporting ATPase subunit alpha